MKPHPDLTPKPNLGVFDIRCAPPIYEFTSRVVGKPIHNRMMYMKLFKNVNPDEYTKLLVAHTNLKWINVIKHLRAMFGMGLKEAKIFMDSIKNKSDIVNLELARMQQEYPELLI